MVLKLYDLAGADDERRFSPYCWRIKMALRHKGLDALGNSLAVCGKGDNC